MASRDPNVLFQVGLPRTDRDGRIASTQDVDELIWHDVVDRPIGLDSLNEPGRPMGFEVFEALVPSIDVRDDEMTLHSNNRSALSANGKRYQVLRWTDGVQVLVGDRQVMTLAAALKQLRASGGSRSACAESLSCDRLAMRNEPSQRTQISQTTAGLLQRRAASAHRSRPFFSDKPKERSRLAQLNSSPHLMRNWYTTLVSS